MKKYLIYIFTIMMILSLPVMVKGKDYVIISEIMYDTPLNEVITTPPYSNGEFIRLDNIGTSTVDLSGWILKGGGVTETFSFPSGTKLPPQSKIIVAYQYNNSNFTLDQLYDNVFDNYPSLQIFYQRKIVLSNSGESITLKDYNGIVRDSIFYDGTSNKKKSDRLSADNEGNINGWSCSSIQRITANFEQDGSCIPSNSEWTTSSVLLYNQNLSFVMPDLPSPLNLSIGHNYIKTAIYTSDDGKKTMDAVQYYDGLGRPTQTVNVSMNPDGLDLVTVLEYDQFGRDSIVWLPVLSDLQGGIVPKHHLQQEASYLYGNNSYSKPVYEASPLNRVLEQYGPGEDWHTKGKSVKVEYLTNKGGDIRLECYKFTKNNLKKGTLWPDGAFFVIKTTDEDGNISYEFKDQLGRLMLSRQVNNNENYDTYYVYDVVYYKELVAVLPPLAIDNDLTEEALNQFAYFYKYDKRRRCIEKKLPGCEPIYYIYDKANQLILSQDGEQRKLNKWVFNCYDKMGRLIFTGLHTQHPTESYESLKTAINNAIIQEQADSQNGWFWGYTYNTLFHLLKTDNLSMETLLINYYDNYDVVLGKTGPTIYNYFSGGEGNDESQPSGFSRQKQMNAKGKLVATIDFYSREHGAYVPTIMYYDNRGNMVQSRSRPPLGLQVEFIDYNFTGQPTQRRIVHNVGGANNVENYTYTYDHAGRLTRTTHKLNGNAAIVLADNTYDELGRLIETRINNQDKLTTNYTYNIRSWTKSISSPLFSQQLYYNESYNGNNPQYNGNISATISGDVRYNFEYDNLSQLTHANYIRNMLGTKRTYNYSTGYSYDKHGNILSLLRNGLTNDNRVQKHGQIDNLTVDYTGNQRKLVIEQSANNPIMDTSYDFKDFSEGSGQYYKYNLNGSMIEDPYKKTVMSYDLYNGMPKSTSVNNMMTKGLNVYKYTASGQKLEVKYNWDPNGIAQPLSGTAFTEADIDNLTGWNETEYMGNLVCQAWNIKKMLLDNGYYDFTDNKYYFYIKDHLGNNRVVADAQGVIAQRNDYYPFGMPFGGNHEAGVQPYKFVGKEFDTMNGIDKYDQHARQYDPVIPTFDGFDPMAEKHYNLSPYVYCMNNPIKYVDPLGLDTLNFSHDGKLVSFTIGGNDVLNVTNKKGKVVSKSFEAGTFSSYGDKKGDNGYAFVSGNNAENSKSMFEFLADNTTVEWGNATFQNKDGSMSHYVTNSHREAEENGLSDLTIENQWYDRALIKHDHSHPDRNHYPSGAPDSHYTESGDIPFAHMKTERAILNKQPIPSFRIYIPGKGYLRYTPFTTNKMQRMYLNNPYIFYQK